MDNKKKPQKTIESKQDINISRKEKPKTLNTSWVGQNK